MCTQYARHCSLHQHILQSWTKKTYQIRIKVMIRFATVASHVAGREDGVLTIIYRNIIVQKLCSTINNRVWSKCSR